jgi:hypothetical protein
VVVGGEGVVMVTGAAGAASAGWLLPEFLQETNTAAKTTALMILYMVGKISN